MSQTSKLKGLIFVGIVLTVVMLFAFLVGFFMVGNEKLDPSLESELTAERLKPIGTVVTSDMPQPAAATASAPQSPEELYNTVCAACHSTGVLGAPKVDSADDWKPRLAKGGVDVLLQSAISGLNAMPPRGGSSASDDELKGAIEFMLNKAGAL